MAPVDTQKGYQQGDPPLCLDTTPINSGPSPHTQASHDTEERPPTNETMYGSAKVAKTQSRGVDFLKRFIAILVGLMLFTIVIGLLMAIPVAMIAIGSIHLDDCPVKTFIPVFLIVSGSVWTILCLVILAKACCCPKSQETEGEEEKKKLNPCEAVVYTFMACWFVSGNVWVYRTYGHFDSDPASGNYCDHTLYWFAFWMITVTYIMFGCLALTCCISMLVDRRKTRK